MHIILAILGAIVSILILVKRLSDAGIDIGWLNPFAWKRRRAWQKKYQGDPIFSLKDPMEVAALLATTLAKIDGEISKEEKAILLSLFQNEFGRSEKEASDLLMSSVFLFGNGESATSKPDKVLQPSLDNFTLEQAQSVMTLLHAIKDIDSKNTDLKQQFIEKVDNTFSKKFDTSSKW